MPGAPRYVPYQIGPRQRRDQWWPGSLYPRSGTGCVDSRRGLLQSDARPNDPPAWLLGRLLAIASLQPASTKLGRRSQRLQDDSAGSGQPPPTPGLLDLPDRPALGPAGKQQPRPPRKRLWYARRHFRRESHSGGRRSRRNSTALLPRDAPVGAWRSGANLPGKLIAGKIQPPAVRFSSSWDQCGDRKSVV